MWIQEACKSKSALPLPERSTCIASPLLLTSCAVLQAHLRHEQEAVGQTRLEGESERESLHRCSAVDAASCSCSCRTVCQIASTMHGLKCWRMPQLLLWPHQTK
jgi:hypothetical protein